MWILTRKRLADFWAKHAGAKTPLKAWTNAVEAARWAGPADIRRDFSTASFVGDRVVFNIGGNNYRLVVSVDFEKGRLFVRFVGTHSEYDRIDVKEV